MYRVIKELTHTSKVLDGATVACTDTERFQVVNMATGTPELECGIEIKISEEQAESIDAAVRKVDTTCTDYYFAVMQGKEPVACGISRKLAEAIRDGLGEWMELDVYEEW